MYQYFLKPMGKIFGAYILVGLSIVSDIAQVTNFNFLDFLIRYSPQSFYFLIAGTLLVYFALVAIEFHKKPIQQSTGPERRFGQFISTGNVKNSTIIQIKKDKED
jgi:hypothetical protein